MNPEVISVYIRIRAPAVDTSTGVIEGISISGVHLEGPQSVKCSRAQGSFKDCPKCAACKGLSPAN